MTIEMLVKNVFIAPLKYHLDQRGYQIVQVEGEVKETEWTTGKVSLWIFAMKNKIK